MCGFPGFPDHGGYRDGMLNDQLALLRTALVRLTERPGFRRLATESPSGKRVAARFVAGTTLDDAMAAARMLDRVRIATMLDHLGEHVETPDQATAAAAAYVDALESAEAAGDLDCAISVKPTQLGLDLSVDTCTEHLERLLAVAERSSTLVMLDMESHEYVDRTIEVHRRLREDHDRVGVCLQSYLLRSAQDVFDLPARSIVRLVKGAYLEPEGVAYRDRATVDEHWRRLFTTLMMRGHVVHVATHDPELIEGARAFVERRGMGWSRVEFQFLYGIRADLQQRLAADGYPVRVYVPYGAEWYPYLTRRLAERPANLWFFASNLFRSGVARG